MRRPLGQSAKLHCAFGDEIDVAFDIFVHFVEEFMKRNEIRAFHVPVCVFALRLQINGVGKPIVAQCDNFAARGLRKIILRWIHLVLRSPKASMDEKLS